MDMIDRRIKLRPFCDLDIELFTKWLYADHVMRWFEHPQNWLNEIDKRKDEFSFIHHFIVEVNSEPIGFCQYYEYCKGGETWNADFSIDGVYSIDYLIGDRAHLRKGYGKAIIEKLTAKINRIDGARCIIVQPEPENKASCASLLSAGYTFDNVNKMYIYTLSEKRKKE